MAPIDFQFHTWSNYDGYFVKVYFGAAIVMPKLEAVLTAPDESQGPYAITPKEVTQAQNYKIFFPTETIRDLKIPGLGAKLLSLLPAHPAYSEAQILERFVECITERCVYDSRLANMLKDVVNAEEVAHKVFPALVTKQKHPVTGHSMYLQAIVIDLNDSCGWTREQVADWLETLDVDIDAVYTDV